MEDDDSHWWVKVKAATMLQAPLAQIGRKFRNRFGMRGRDAYSISYNFQIGIHTPQTYSSIMNSLNCTCRDKIKNL